jgi:mucin-2
VQPIPFLVTTAPKTPVKTSGTVAETQASPSNRPRVSVNPFSPLSVQPSAPQAAPTAQTPTPTPSINTPFRPNTVSPGTANLPPIRPAPSVQVSGTGQPLPSFPNQGNPGQGNPGVGNTGTPGSATSVNRPGNSSNSQMSTPKPNTVKPVPTAITTAKPQISAPAATPTRTDVPTPLTAGALPVAPSILREVVPQGPTDTGPTPINPVTPELPSNTPVISTPTTPTAPSELSPPPSEPATPTPLSSTTPASTTPTTPATPTPPTTLTTPTPTSTPLSNFILSRQVSFVGVIIGPVNTAILETKDGTVIVPLGGTIPQSDVVVKSVTATQVVLVLGQETVTIERSKK